MVLIVDTVMLLDIQESDYYLFRFKKIFIQNTEYDFGSYTVCELYRVGVVAEISHRKVLKVLSLYDVKQLCSSFLKREFDFYFRVMGFFISFWNEVCKDVYYAICSYYL